MVNKIFKGITRRLINRLKYSQLGDQSKLIRNYLYDYTRFAKHSSALISKSGKQKALSMVIMDYHRLEKGLALRTPRPGFGQDVVERLLRNISELGVTSDFVISALDCLGQYFEYQSKCKVDVARMYKQYIELRNRLHCDAPQNMGGVVSLTRDSILKSSVIDLKSFFESRYSVRDFSDTHVSLVEIEKAVSMAIKTPSVCNRQSWHVHLFQKDPDIQRLLHLQNGNRGFNHQIHSLLVITVDLNRFVAAGERNQFWIDGGMFAMSLIYALHSLGIATCCLNWSVEYGLDQAVHREAGLRDDESVIMMLACGYLPDQLNVANSLRKSVSETLTTH